jgi:hypothetical protein
MKDGHHRMCKECRSKHDNWASRNKAHCSLRAKKYYENNKITCIERSANWYMSNKDRRMQLNKIWVSDNPEKVRIKMSKICKTCNEEKPLDLFSKEKRNSDGHAGQCISCRKEYVAKYYIKNKEEIDKKNKINFNNNREKFLQVQKIYYQKNLEQALLQRKEWRQRNPEKVKESNQKHKYKKAICSKNLTDSYVKSQLTKRTPICNKEIPQELIELKRIQMLINREIRNKNVINNY